MLNHMTRFSVIRLRENLQLPYSLQNKNNRNNGQKRWKCTPFKAELYSEVTRNNQWKDLLHTLNQLVQGSSPWRITKYGGFSAANPHIWGFEPAKSAGSSFFGAVWCS